MREIRDNLYIFLCCRENVGEIVASRDNNSSLSIGKDVFDILNISSDEKSFFFECMRKEGDSCIAVQGGTDGQEKIIVFVRFFAYSSSLCLAIDLDFTADAMADAICSGAVWDIHISPKVLARRNQCLSGKAQDAVAYIRSLWLALSSMYHIELSDGLDNIYDLEVAFSDICNLVGIVADCRMMRSNNDCFFREAERVFSGRLCVAFMLVIAMHARENSKERALGLDIIYGEGDIKLEFTYYKEDGITDKSSLALLAEIVRSYGMTVEIDDGSDLLRCRFDPYYTDISLIGAKQGNYQFSLAKWREIF